MVEDRITDGERIAQLLASELTGLEVSPLDSVTIVDADRDVSSSLEGPVAYRIQYREQHVGRVRLYPEFALLKLDVPVGTVLESPLDIERDCVRGEPRLLVTVDSGVAVKPAMDLIRSVLVDFREEGKTG